VNADARLRLALGLALALALPAGAAAAPLQAATALARSVRSTGRAEVTLRYLMPVFTGGERAVSAVLALEPPDRARIDVPATGEKIVARADGGEWLQPSARQLLRFKPSQGAAALRWWRALLDPGRGASERRAPDGHWVLTLRDEQGAAIDSADVWLDARGYPARLRSPAGTDDASTYRLSGWRFTRARGEAAFHLSAPPGVESVEMP
jgi:hypothetical protein